MLVAGLNQGVKKNSTVKTATNRGKSYTNREDAIYAMNEMVMKEADKTGADREIGAFVYQAEDGLFYISNTFTGMGSKVYAKHVNAELERLGLLTDGMSPEDYPTIDFTHSHLYNDLRNDAQDIIVDVKKTKNAITNLPDIVTKPIQFANQYKVYTQHGSGDDFLIIEDKRMNGGKYKLNSFGILAPKGTSYTGEWNEPEIKRFN